MELLVKWTMSSWTVPKKCGYGGGRGVGGDGDGLVVVGDDDFCYFSSSLWSG